MNDGYDQTMTPTSTSAPLPSSKLKRWLWRYTAAFVPCLAIAAVMIYGRYYAGLNTLEIIGVLALGYAVTVCARKRWQARRNQAAARRVNQSDATAGA